MDVVDVGDASIRLWRVEDLDRHVDREALLRAEAPPEPPYWAHLWSGAHVLAKAVPGDAGRVLELGCGLGLPSLAAATRGGRVLATDTTPAALAFVRASAIANRLGTVEVAAMDFTRLALRTHVDLVLAAEILYDRSAFGPLAEVLVALLERGASALLADARRIDTADFYRLLEARGVGCMSEEVVVVEEGFPLRVRLSRLTRR